MYTCRNIGYRNPHWQSLPKSVTLTYLSVYESRDGASESAPSPSLPSSFTHVHRASVIATPTPTVRICPSPWDWRIYRSSLEGPQSVYDTWYEYNTIQYVNTILGVDTIQRSPLMNYFSSSRLPSFRSRQTRYTRRFIVILLVSLMKLLCWCRKFQIPLCWGKASLFGSQILCRRNRSRVVSGLFFSFLHL